MKIMKKMFALVIATVMVLALALPAMAETVKISTPTGHTYEVFQVFKGDVDADDSTKLNSLVYGANSTKTEDAPVTQADLDILTALTGTDLVGTEGQALIDTLSQFVDFDSTPVTTVASGTESEDLPTGYYVIRDLIDDLPGTEGATLYMFKVLNDDLTITAKSDKPSSDKKVDDINDSDLSATGDNVKLGTSADYDIGDEIPYTLTFTLPSDYANFEHYYVKFYDDMCKGLTFKAGSAQIKYGSADAIDYVDPSEAASSVYTDGKQYTWEIIDLKTGTDAQKALAAGDVITITYKAVLNSDAVIGLPGNPNQYNVEFSNNPNNTGDGTKKPDDTGKTPVAVTFVLTYETIFNKVDENNDPITGADFELYKFVESEAGTDTLGEGDSAKKGTWTLVTALGGDFHPAKSVTDSDNVEDATFTFTGLDDGTYKLVETETPTGYNPIADVVFEISAEHTVTGGVLSLTSLTGTDGDQFTLTPDTSAGSLTGDIENKSGATLPSTGGIGTTIFYVIGGILVVLAGVVLVTKRKSAE